MNKIVRLRRLNQRLGDIKERQLTSLISRLEFPDKPLIIPCSIQGKNLALPAEVTQNESFRANQRPEWVGQIHEIPGTFSC